jgi:curli biogenesis system outer membrane secretion channel CsgG
MAKRNLLMVMGWAVLFAACASKGPAPVAAAQDTQVVAADGTDELDAAIREASDYLNGKVTKGSKAVFLNIKSDYPDLSEYLLSTLSENAVNDGVFSVVDRQQLDTIRAELNFQMSGEVSDESAQSIGQMLGAQSIVSGAVSKLGSLYRVQVKAIEVQSAGVQGQWSRNVPNGATIAALTENYAPAGAVAARAPTTAPARNTPSAATPATIYKVGDTGPAGGIVFYDKFSSSGGWRYLEVAPVETEQQFPWGYSSHDGTSHALGDGKKNTQFIVEELRKNKVGGAAQYCDDLEYGGYADWFLPSRDELDLIYRTLKERGLGGFGSDWYWSSSGGVGYDYEYAQKFSNGQQDTSNRNNTYAVRAVRQF